MNPAAQVPPEKFVETMKDEIEQYAKDVMEAVEGPILLCRCRQRVERCGEDVCDTHEFWHGVETLLTEQLQSMTFAALAGPRRSAPGTQGRPQATRR